MSIIFGVGFYGLLWQRHPEDAKVFLIMIALFNTIPAVVAAFVLGLAALLGGVRILLWGWLPLTLVLSVPYWLWAEKKWLQKIGRRIDEEVDRRVAATRDELGRNEISKKEIEPRV